MSYLVLPTFNGCDALKEDPILFMLKFHYIQVPLKSSQRNKAKALYLAASFFFLFYKSTLTHFLLYPYVCI